MEQLPKELYHEILLYLDIRAGYLQSRLGRGQHGT